MVQERDKQPHFFQSLDWFTILLWLLLIVAGWVSIYAATYSFGEAPTLDMASRAGKQIIWIGMAITIGGVILLVDDRIYDTVAYILYFLMLGLLAITPFIATEHKGSLSWISFGSISLQPAEFAKTITALALARLMGSYGFSLSRPRHFILAGHNPIHRH